MSKNKRNVILSIIFIVLLVAAFIFIMFRLSNSSDNSAQSEASATKETAQSTDKTVADNEPKEFVLLESKEPTLQGKVGYFTEKFDGEEAYLISKESIDGLATEENKVQGLKTFIGNQVYQIPSSGDSVPIYFQLCGYTLCRVDTDGYIDDFSSLRQEFTGKRIYVADSEDDLAKLQSEWDNGQKILNGEENGKYGSIIVNGRLIENASFIEVNGDYYVPLTYVGKAVNSRTYSVNPTTSKLYLPMEFSEGVYTIEIPYQSTAVGSTHTNGYFSAGNDSPFLGDTWEDKFRTGDTNQCYVPVSELSRYTGWYIYSNGNVISIVSDEPDVSDLFVLNTQGNRSAEAQLNNGNTITKVTDPSNPNYAPSTESSGEEAQNAD